MMIPREHEEPMSFGEWLRTLLLLAVPLLGFILLIYWACSENGKTNRRNFARANLALMLIVVIGAGLLAAASVPLFQKVRDASVAKAEELKAKQRADAASSSPSSSESAETSATGTGAASDAPKAKPATTPIDEPLRTFRSADGRTIEAQVVSLTDEQVTIRRADGREFTTDMTRFSAEDVEYFMRLRHGGGAFD